MQTPTFLLLLLTVYAGYFLLMILWDVSKAKNTATVKNAGSTDFIVPVATTPPVKVIPPADNHAELWEDHPVTENREAPADAALMEALGIETISNSSGFEIDNLSLNYLLS